MRHLKGGVLRVEILDACLKELRSFPKEVLRDFLDATAKLDAGLILSMPFSRSLPSLGAGVHKLRLKGKTGIFRVIYYIKKKEAIYMVHAFTKKSQKTPQKSIKLALKRIKRFK
ncbi:MAG: hypothetical protein CMJ16_00615 [Peredibacter sp.]|nr:hypothetical protein [Peredibacter sp.]